MRLSATALCCAIAVAAAPPPQRLRAGAVHQARAGEDEGGRPLDGSLVLIRDGRIERVATISNPRTFGSSKKMPKEAWKAVIDRGHQRNLPVAAHIFYLEDANDLLREGIDLIAHSVRDTALDAEFIALATDRDVCVVPTLTREVSTFVYESTPAFFADEFFRRHADAAAVAELTDPARQAEVRKSRSAARYKAALAVATANFKRLSESGVTIAFGTDTGPPSRFQIYFEHLELEMMVAAGLTPMQAIVAATGDAARCMKGATGLGTIAPGAPADLAVYAEDPTKDIRHTRTIESVWIGGIRLP